MTEKHTPDIKSDIKSDIRQDIRWQQRFVNYKRAFSQLTVFLQNKNLNTLEKQGLIQAFEYTHELAWKVLADFLKDRGNIDFSVQKMPHVKPLI